MRLVHMNFMNMRLVHMHFMDMRSVLIELHGHAIDALENWGHAFGVIATKKTCKNTILYKQHVPVLRSNVLERRRWLVAHSCWGSSSCRNTRTDLAWHVCVCFAYGGRCRLLIGTKKHETTKPRTCFFILLHVHISSCDGCLAFFFLHISSIVTEALHDVPCLL